MSMELLPLLQSKSIAEDKDDYVGKVMTLFQWNGGSLSGSAAQSEIKWKSRSGKNGDPKIDSVMVVSKSLATCFTIPLDFHLKRALLLRLIFFLHRS